MTASSVAHAPAGPKWEFDQSVTECFEDMLARSIPQYEVMRRACTDLAKRFVQPDTDIVDLGCSRGEAMAELVREFGARNRFVGVEVSPPMLAACRQRFAGLIRAGVVSIEQIDLRTAFPACRASVILAVLTVQFTPIEYRQRIVSNVVSHLAPGGAFIMVEKVLGASTLVNDTMVDLYYDLKRANGYSYDQIERKRCALEGVLVPLPAGWNEQLLRSAGFAHVDCFWRWMNFAGWLAVRGDGGR